MVVERRFAFEADSEWIKQNFKCNKIADQVNEPKLLIQQESR
jgi:hypothetical protein